MKVLSGDLIAKILDEAKRIMFETGMEIRGKKMRRLVKDGFLKQKDLPELPPRAEAPKPKAIPGRRGRVGPRRRSSAAT